MQQNVLSNFELQILLLSLASFGSLVMAGHFDEDQGGSTYEEKTKHVEIPIIKKYGKLIFRIKY